VLQKACRLRSEQECIVQFTTPWNWPSLSHGQNFSRLSGAVTREGVF
jgi:hypothetical protein